MKCEFCGANIDIESPVCPHCGMQKRQFEQHRSDMNRFRQEFQYVRDDVVEENKRFSKKASYITVLCVLIAINLLLLVGISANYSIYHFFNEKNVERHASQHAKVLDQFETDGEFERLYYYYSENNLYYGDDTYLAEYNVLYRFCASYESFTNNLPFFTIKDYGPDYYTDENRLQRVEYVVEAYDQLSKLYEQVLNQDPYLSYDHPEVFEQKHMDSYQQMMDNMDNYLMTYCHFDEEKLAQFKETSKTRQILMLEEVYESEGLSDEQ